MKTEIEVTSREEARLIKAGLSDPATRALVAVIGALLPFPKRAQARMLSFVADQCGESNGAP